MPRRLNREEPEPAGLDTAHRITMLPQREEFPAHPDEDLLTAALRSGRQVMYGCRHGNCGTCLHRLVDGEVVEAVTSPYVLSADARDQGAILLCSTYARSDVTIESSEADVLAEDIEVIPPEQRMAEVRSTSGVTPSVVELRVALDRPLSFRAGQYVEVWVPGSDCRRSLSIASAPAEADELSFVVRMRPGGRFASALAGIRPGDTLRLQGPFGHFHFRDSGRPAVMAALGTGIAPILSIILDVVKAAGPPLALYYGGAADERPYVEELERLAAATPHFSLHFAPPPRNGSNEIGMLTQLLAGRLRDGSSHDAYVAGLPPMCDALCALLAAKGTPERHVHVERFYPAEPTRR
ncbi:MAG: 2Fe-2S iron-sulfur cluster-binding protein [Actinomycetota bacterium]